MLSGNKKGKLYQAWIFESLSQYKILENYPNEKWFEVILFSYYENKTSTYNV